MLSRVKLRNYYIFVSSNNQKRAIMPLFTSIKHTFSTNTRQLTDQYGAFCGFLYSLINLFR